jgi:hypothetical protein
VEASLDLVDDKGHVEKRHVAVGPLHVGVESAPMPVPAPSASAAPSPSAAPSLRPNTGTPVKPVRCSCLIAGDESAFGLGAWCLATAATLFGTRRALRRGRLRST